MSGLVEYRLWPLVFCLFCAPLPGRADEWPQWRGPKRDGVWRETGIVEKLGAAKLEPRWSAPIAGGYGGPAVADGRVYVTDRIVSPNQMERVHCFDAFSGETVWNYWYACPYIGVGYDAGPRATMTLEEGRAYSLGSMGNLICFEAATGKIRWKRDLFVEYKIDIPSWGIAASPLIEGDLIVVQIGGEQDACLVAFDKKTGAERWHALEDEPSYSSPVVAEQAGKRVLIAWTGERVVGLDPLSGHVYWSVPFPPVKWVRNTASPVVEGDLVFLSAFFTGAMLLRLRQDKPLVEKVWQRRGESEKKTDAIHSSISTCALVGEYIYGVDSHGELRCLEVATGDRVWESLEATPNIRWSNIFFVRHGDFWWLLNELGELIRCKLSPQGYEEISRAKLIEPTQRMLPKRRGGVIWSHPAFAYKHVFARSDREIVCVSLASDS